MAGPPRGVMAVYHRWPTRVEKKVHRWTGRRAGSGEYHGKEKRRTRTCEQQSGLLGEPAALAFNT